MGRGRPRAEYEAETVDHLVQLAAQKVSAITTFGGAETVPSVVFYHNYDIAHLAGLELQRHNSRLSSTGAAAVARPAEFVFS